MTSVHTSSLLREDRKRSAPRAAGSERAQSLWGKAQVASTSARLLLEVGDGDGAVNRAYYATFAGARAALAMVRSSLAMSKRHGTIFRRFEKHVVQERGLDPSLGKEFLYRQRSARQIADYEMGEVGEPAAREAIAGMQRFLGAVEPFLKRANR